MEHLVCLSLVMSVVGRWIRPLGVNLTLLMGGRIVRRRSGILLLSWAASITLWQHRGRVSHKRGRVVWYPTKSLDAKQHAKIVEGGMETNCFFSTQGVHVDTQANHISIWTACQVHLGNIASRQEARSGGGVMPCRTLKSKPMRHAGGFFSIKYGTKIQINSFSYPKV
jgi:hypothetical protein